MAIRKADLIKYKVQDSGDDPCTECTVTGNSPIVIAGKPYCLWCALRAACGWMETVPGYDRASDLGIFRVPKSRLLYPQHLID